MISSEYLRDQVPGIDSDMVQYISSLVEDVSLDPSEREELMSEYLLSVCEIADVTSVCTEYMRLYRAEQSGVMPEALSRITATAVAACLDGMRVAPLSSAAPVVSDARLDDEVKMDLWRRYDDDHRMPKGKHGVEAPLSGDEEIMGLGPNENRLRIVREREEQRARAKKEQEDAHAEKVASKLKAQGDKIRDKSAGKKR